MKASEEPVLKKDFIKKQVNDEKPIVYQASKISQQTSNIFVETVELILKEVRKSFFFDALAYVLREFVSNANKSNLKRIHFKLLGLDINNVDDYKKGMETFSDDFRYKFDEYSDYLIKLNYFTKVVFLVKDDFFVISVTNSSIPTEEEYERITARIDKARFIRNTAEAYMIMEDSSEGAGIGTISSIVMMRNMGVSENSYNFMVDKEKGETTVKLIIPLNTVTKRQAEDISKTIAEEISSIPPLPDKVLAVQNMISNPQISFRRVADAVQRDPALSAELLKIVNSAQYMLPCRVSNLNNAISMIGIKGLRSLLYSYGTQKVFSQKSAKMDTLWKHSFKCASYSYYIAKECGRSDVMDDVYVGGLLHDLGKIIVSNIEPELLEHIKEYCSRKKLQPSFIENLAIGLSHAKIGSEIARHWNFPVNIINQIEFHHQPLIAPDELKFVSQVVYLANFLTHIDDEDHQFEELESSVLKMIGVSTEEEFRKYLVKIDAYYQKQQESD